MEVIIKGEAKEIAALVLAVQEQQGLVYLVSSSGEDVARGKRRIVGYYSVGSVRYFLGARPIATT